MARLTPSITATLGIALLALLSNSPTGTHAANTSMSKPASQQCIQCLDTSLPACGKMRPTDPTYATCLCGDTSSFSTTEAFLPCAKLCVQHEVLEPAVATHQSFMSYCSMMFPKGWCEDSNNPSIGSYWGVSCATGGTMIMVGPDNFFPPVTTGDDEAGSDIGLVTATKTVVETVTDETGSRSTVTTMLLVTSTRVPTTATTTDASNTEPTTQAKSEDPRSSTSTGGGVMGKPVATWGAVAAFGVVAAMA